LEKGSNQLSEALAQLLDLRTAWQRVKIDLQDRVFFNHPYAVPLIELDLDTWLRDRLEAIRRDEYFPASMLVCDVPKGEGLIRPGSHLAYADRLVFTACVGACLPAIHAKIAWSQGRTDFSYQLAGDVRNTRWLRDRIVGWKDFQAKSLEAIRDPISYVVIADIASFYENVDISLLISDLRGANAPEPAVNQIAACLNKWAQVPGRGIPQGQNASDILAKLYLDNIDRVLRDMHYTHFRYVDDIRVFCQTLVDAKLFLIEISKLLRKRGLFLQGAKSAIHPALSARKEIEDVTAVLRELKQTFVDDIINQAGDPYIDFHEAEEFLEANPDDAPLEIIQEAYRAHVVENAGQLNATLFRFLINRLGKQRDSYAADHVVTLLEPHPEETSTILRYLRSVGPGEEIESQIAVLMSSGVLVYKYQFYKIVEWFYAADTDPSEILLELVRELAFDQNSPSYLKTMCRAFLGKFGAAADIERIASSYDETNDPAEHAEIICSIRRMERGRRNGFLARLEHDGGENVRAVRWVRSQS
jgi:hypothetical protein